MARNHKFFFDKDGSPKARGPASEKVFMTFLEVDVQGSDYVCRALMDDLTAIEDGSDDSREFIGNAHQLTIKPDGVLICENQPDELDEPEKSDSEQTNIPPEALAQATPPDAAATDKTATDTATSDAPPADSAGYLVELKHFREILEDWEAFILDDQLVDPTVGDEFL